MQLARAGALFGWATLIGCQGDAPTEARAPGPARAPSPGAAASSAPTATARAVDVCVGAQHSCALDDRGAIRCWGDNGDRQVGPSDLVQTSVPTLVTGLPAARKLACGRASSCAVTMAGEVWCWGYRAGLSPPDAAAAEPPRRLPFEAAVRDFVLTSAGGCALYPAGKVSCLSRLASSFREVTAPGVEGATGFVPLAPESSIACVERGEGATPRCFDVTIDLPPKAKAVATAPAPSQPRAPLVFTDVDAAAARTPTPEPPIPLELGSLRSVRGSGLHACGIDDGGTVHCWGRATAGQLGDRHPYVHPPARVPDLDAVSLSVGKGGACAVQRSGELVCWGRHADGDSPQPMGVVATPFRVDEVAIGASLLDPARICARDAGTGGWHCRFGAEWLAVPRTFVGRPKPALIDAAGGTWNLELRGKPTRTFFFSQVAVPVATVAHDGYCAVDRKGSLACGHCGACSAPRAALTTIAGGEPFVLVGSLTLDAAGEDSVCALTASGRTLCYEIAAAPFSRADPVALAIDGLPAGGVDISSAGGRYEPNLTCVRTASGEVHCFGDERARRRDGALTARRIEGLPPVVGVGTGGSFACAREAAGAIWCWGSNRDGGAPDGAPLERPRGVAVELR